MTSSKNSKLAKSVTKGVGPKDSRPFSSFDDLAAQAVDSGLATDVQAVRVKELSLWGDLLFKWYTQGQIACVFAQNLARDPETSAWHTVVVLDSDWDGSIITGIVDGALEANAEGLQILFPGDNSVEQAINIIRRLVIDHRWSCFDAGWLDEEHGDSLQVGIRWTSPDGSYESWALGIAAFDPMPFTRAFRGAPFIALILRPGPPVESRAPVPTSESQLPASHLAHMDDRLGSKTAKRKKWTEGTAKAKRALVQPDPLSRARARVTFALPGWAKEALKDIMKPSTAV
jgi:hypothetical protein